MNTVDNPFDSVEEAIAAIARGEVIIVTDDEDRENEGDLIMAASKATPEKVNLMIRHGSGIVCVPTLGPWLDRLGLGPMVAQNREVQRTDFAISVDASSGISTGVSAADRTVAIRLLASQDTRADQLVQPGHIFPLRAKPGGVLQRAGHTEAAVDLAVLAGLEPCGVLCELVNDDGTMQRLPELVEFKKKFGLKMISVEQLIAYRLKQEKLVEQVAEEPLLTPHGNFLAKTFKSKVDGRIHFALTLGTLDESTPTLVRVHRANVLRDVFRATCKAGDESALEKSLSAIAKAGRGAVIYIQPPSPTFYRDAKVAVPVAPAGPGAAEFREYGLGAQIVRALGLRKIKLLTQSSKRLVAWEGYDIEIVEDVQL